MCAIPRQLKDGCDAYVSRYHITEYPQAFRLDGGSDRVPVTVEQHPHCLAVRHLDPATGQERWYYLGFFEFRTLVKYIIWGLLLGREKPATWHAWTTIQIDWALRPRIYRQWQRLLQQVDPTVLAVQRKMFAATLRCAPLALRAELYRHPYLVKDIATYRAAALAAVLAWDIAEGDLPLRPRDRFGLICPEELDTSTEASLALMHNWRGLFSPTGSPYRSLNRTLMQLPGGVPYGLVGKLSRVYLQRPLVQRIELIVVTYLTERREPSPNLPIFHQARAPQIKEAMEQVAAYTGNRLSPRRTGDLMLLVDYLADYPDVYHGNIVGLAGRTIRWHRELTALYMAQLREFGAHEFFARWRSLRNATLPPHTLTAQPPLPLPETPGVTFLDTVGAICEEGTDMRHCIASYARGAVDGRHHLFHVTYEGEHATVMVDAYSGRVLQAHGPRNQRNNAVAWGTRVLNQWGRQWPQGSNYDHERGDMG